MHKKGQLGGRIYQFKEFHLWIGIIYDNDVKKWQKCQGKYYPVFILLFYLQEVSTTRVRPCVCAQRFSGNCLWTLVTKCFSTFYLIWGEKRNGEIKMQGRRKEKIKERNKRKKKKIKTKNCIMQIKKEKKKSYFWFIIFFSSVFLSLNPETINS